MRQYKSRYRGKYRQHAKGEWYFKDLSMDAEFYLKMLRCKLLPRLREIRAAVWDEHFGREAEFVLQHDGASPHRKQGVEDQINGMLREVGVRVVRQPPRSPGCNMLDMAVNHSLASKVAKNDYLTKEQLHCAVMV